MKTTTFTCAECRQTIRHENDFTNGYGIDKDGRKVCFACCAMIDADQMDKDGRATLYLTDNKVTNWPGTLSIPVKSQKTGRHNIAGIRQDVWFRFNKRDWHGVQYGECTQICHCRAIKSA